VLNFLSEDLEGLRLAAVLEVHVPSKFLWSFKIMIRTLRPKVPRKCGSLGCWVPILKIFAVRTPHVGFGLDHSGAFLLFSSRLSSGPRDSSKKRRPEVVRRSGKASGPDFEQGNGVQSDSKANDIPPCVRTLRVQLDRDSV
jgi:hypothetical protein